MNEPCLIGLLDTVWSHISLGASDRTHPARHPTLATIGPDGPEARSVVLRGADREAGTLEFFTDATSPKHAQITTDPHVALHIWVPEARLQIRVRAMATLHRGDPALFAKLPPEAQANYGGPAPGTPDQRRTGTVGDPGRFALIRCHLTEIDTLLLAGPHHRAIYRASDEWLGQWVAS
jgi:hypothetical protein